MSWPVAYRKQAALRGGAPLGSQTGATMLDNLLANKAHRSTVGSMSLFEELLKRGAPQLRSSTIPLVIAGTVGRRIPAVGLLNASLKMASLLGGVDTKVAKVAPAWTFESPWTKRFGPCYGGSETHLQHTTWTLNPTCTYGIASDTAFSAFLPYDRPIAPNVTGLLAYSRYADHPTPGVSWYATMSFWERPNGVAAPTPVWQKKDYHEIVQIQTNPMDDPKAVPISQLYNVTGRVRARGRSRVARVLAGSSYGYSVSELPRRAGARPIETPDFTIVVNVPANGGGAADPPELTTGTTYRKPPPKRTKEKKVHFGLHAAPGSVKRLVKWLGAITEGGDLVRAFYKALPKKIRDECFGRHNTNGRMAPQGMALCLYEFWDEVDFEQAIMNAISNEIQDQFIGRFSSAANKAYGKAGGSTTVTLGPVL